MPSDAGFTLLEILIAMIIISIVIGMAVFMVGDRRSQYLDHEARRLMAMLDMSAQEAILQFAELGVVFDNQSYRFVIFDDKEQVWKEYTSPGQRSPFRHYELPEGMFLELDFEGIRQASGASIETLTLIDERELERFADDPDESETLQPQVILFSSGEITEFDLFLGYDDFAERPKIRVWQDGTIERIEEP